MALYLISYDLIQTKNYPKLHDAIRKYGNYCKPLESTWIIQTADTTINIRDYCLQYIDIDDRLFVVKLEADTAAWYNLPADVPNWLKAR
ncbi:hypothetical protein C3Y98_04470 [Methylotenera oryzisoli]|uniref:SinR-like protein n=1 Tax=Methylotenera oryzisoli TaxID=2080758 RepID=A0A4Y9VSF1_9PROT|nr:hypothetical protein C3Y98_04470 [Methylotenera oryzisoli]